jgi:hypothetical protein
MSKKIQASASRSALLPCRCYDRLRCCAACGCVRLRCTAALCRLALLRAPCAITASA